jgi:Cu-Zn family superoxide dismutase
MLKLLKRFMVAFCMGIGIITPVLAEDITVPVFFTSEHGFGSVVGTVIISETKHGLLFIPNLHGLKPGLHGFHVHVNPNCENNGMAAGGHFDPEKNGKHLGPYNDNGHLGDLPVLVITADGSTKIPVIAPRIKHLSEIKNRSLMIHEGGDNYSDTPIKLGGGGARMVCGVIKGD